mmetsp:Transcript_28306/g.51096  ORF Transcript_28306/g.51096 Transcript_28306/m.51096 type:complete len:161 (+) Transcript_28306:62-544(+)
MLGQVVLVLAGSAGCFAFPAGNSPLNCAELACDGDGQEMFLLQVGLQLYPGRGGDARRNSSNSSTKRSVPHRFELQDGSVTAALEGLTSSISRHLSGLGDGAMISARTSAAVFLLFTAAFMLLCLCSSKPSITACYANDGCSDVSTKLTWGSQASSIDQT